MRTCESYVTVKQNITFATSRMMAESPGPGLPAAMRYLVKDVDFFAGFAHAIHTYLGGVALAHANHMRLLHVPFQSAHGLGYAFDDFLAGDERGLVAPLAAPALTSDAHGGDHRKFFMRQRWGPRTRTHHLLPWRHGLCEVFGCVCRQSALRARAASGCFCTSKLTNVCF